MENFFAFRLTEKDFEKQSEKKGRGCQGGTRADVDILLRQPHL